MSFFGVYGKALGWLWCSESVCAQITAVSRGSSCNLRGCPMLSTAVHFVSPKYLSVCSHFYVPGSGVICVDLSIDKDPHLPRQDVLPACFKLSTNYSGALEASETTFKPWVP